ncbi:hypothetical protein NP233_g6837 [Leucocoprinus birnbaumii]|uniref:DUF6535 domain-containing protein n=1 Tax=Leucocoprinus birnbaumii TaxID=56174 RepID=A0AAD5YQK6_9AGAR|nr:hypothetical protein NP233_g6837 [Leucocoprinus birnbaumii]
MKSMYVLMHYWAQDITKGASPKDHWKRFYEAIDQQDEEFCKSLRDEISDLLLIVRTFIIVIQWLRDDDPQVTLLKATVILLNNSSTNPVNVDPDLGNLRPFELKVNQLWLLSMTLSLSAVVIGTICLQWISAFRHANDKYQAGAETLALPQVRYEGIWTWGVPHIAALLIISVQAALVFFTFGLMYLFWNVHRHAAEPVAIVGGIAMLAVCWTLGVPVILSAMCYLRLSMAHSLSQRHPFKNPWTWTTHHTCT